MDTALFSPCSLFGTEDQLSESDSEDTQTFVERGHSFPGMVLLIREFSFHQVNANMLWPGASIFAEWLIEYQYLLKGRRIIELGSGTGALAIFLKKSLAVDITTSDFDDKEIEDNIAYNCRANGISVLPHIRHTWGQEFGMQHPDWDLIVASDILLCKCGNCSEN
uniref:Methyltransferase small domain-containing protein n=1 Tax=Picea sitchensis TaxID=3332 RepID=D5AAH6_PICSI|nr:unknown [Picea sitchensis]